MIERLPERLQTPVRTVAMAIALGLGVAACSEDAAPVAQVDISAPEGGLPTCTDETSSGLSIDSPLVVARITAAYEGSNRPGIDMGAFGDEDVTNAEADLFCNGTDASGNRFIIVQMGALSEVVTAADAAGITLTTGTNG